LTPVSETVVTLDQDVTKVYADPVQHAPATGTPLFRSAITRLHSHCAFDRIDHRGKLKQHTVSGGLHEPTAVFCHEGVGSLAVFA